MSAQLASQQQTEPSSFRRALSLISSSPPPRQEEQQEQGQAEQGQEKTADNEQQLQFGGPMPGGHPAFEPDALAHLMASFAAHHHQQQQQQQQNGGGQLGPPMLPPMGQPMPPDFPAALLAQFPVPFGPFAHGPPPHHHQQNGSLPPPGAGAGGPQQPMPPFPFPLDAASLAAFQPFMLPPENRPRKNATREVTAPLKHWLNEHRKNPYPTKAEKTLLACLTRMTMTQVSTWFANARRRLKKENKMTWSPRNRPTEDEEEDGDGDGALGSQSGEGPSSSGSPAATHQQALEADEAAQKQLQQRKSLARERCGIWSIADTLGEQVVSSREEENKNQQNGQAETDGREQFSNNHRQQHQQEEVGPEETGNAAAGNGHPQHPQLGPLANGQLPLLDGLFPPGMLPPQLALSLGLPPGPDPHFLLALAMQQHQQQQQPPPLPPPPPHRLLQLNPFVLLAQHLAMANCQPPMAKADPSPAMAPADQAPPLPTPTMPSSAGGPSPPLAPPPSMPPASSLAGHKRSAPKSEASSTAAPEGLPMAKRQCRPAQS